MKIINKIIFALTLLAVCSQAAWAGNTTITARLDSATLLMGKTTAMHIEIVQDKGTVGFFPWENSDTISSMVEIAAKNVADTTDLGNGRIQINRDIILQSFDSGMYVITPLPYVVNKDTVRTPKLALKVVPVMVDSLQSIHDYKPVIDVPFEVFDWVPDFIADYWWIYLILMILASAGLYYYFFWYKKGRKLGMSRRKRLPPYEEAMVNLKNLKNENLWQNGREKEYFTGLTDILRVYIDRRFKINAMEMTSSQIIDTLKKNKETLAVKEQLSMILEVADMVKFANVRPLADDNELAYKHAMDFVELTKPVEEAAEKQGEEGQE
ncbi:MAG: cell wall anchor protein [Muribaculaceae bacterium]|nr:cell wall anchor protein [Muribaculaceae bacterium]